MCRIKRVWSLFLVLAVLLTFAACGDEGASEASEKQEAASESAPVFSVEHKEVKRFLRYLDDSAYADAIALYNEEITGNAVLEQETSGLLAAYLQDIEAGVLAGRYSDQEAKTKTTTVDNIVSQISCTVEDYEQLTESIDLALASKVAYRSGVALMEQGNYKDAIAELAKVLPEDADYADAAQRYASAVENYKNAVKSTADASIAKGDYITAIDAYQQAAAVLPEDSDVLVWLNTCEKNYVADVIAQANAAFTDYTQYQQSLAVISAALQYYPDNGDLLERKEYFSSFAPVAITTLREYDNYNMEIEEAVEDPLGNNHKDAMQMQNYYAYDTGYVVYLLEGNYNKLTFTVFGTNPGSTYMTGVSVRDYTSGNYDTSITLYENQDIRCSVLPFEVEVDVTGVQMVRLWCKEGVAIADCTVQRTVK